jgi:hypothetical protein
MDPIERLLSEIEPVAKQATIARAETIALRSICGVLLSELVRGQPDPEGRLGELIAMMQGAAEGALLEFGAEDVAVVQSQAIEHVARIAEAQFGKPPPFGEAPSTRS